MARPRVEINWVDFDKLCALQCTQVEIAEWFDCSIDTIARAVKREHKEGFAEYYKKKSSKGKISLRRYQWEMAKKNTTMAIWLGKQYLGQRDDPMILEDDLPDGFEITEFSSISTSE